MRQTPVARISLAAVALVILVVRPATAQNRCAGSKIKATGKAARCLLNQESKAALDARSTPTGSDLATRSCWARSESDAKRPVSRPATGGDRRQVSAFVADVSGQLAPGLPDEKKCQSLKIKATGTKTKCRLAQEARAAARGLPVDPVRVMKCISKFDNAFAEAEAQHHCTTTSDASDIEDTVDAFVVDVVTELTPGGSPSGAFVAGELPAR
jgi:hypothetical protein